MATETMVEPTLAATTYPLYNTTFTTHRVSPLYHGPTVDLFDPAVLNDHARRFRDILKGDVLRGVHVGLAAGGDELGRAGALLDCTWTALKDESTWADAEATEDITQMSGGNPDAGAGGQIYVQVKYESATYSALFLQDRRAEAGMEEKRFTHLPILLTRMPGPLRTTFLDFVSSSFDARTSLMKLTSRFIKTTFEDVVAHLASESEATLKNVVKEVQLTLSFPAPTTPLLKTLDITLTREDVYQFWKRGKAISEGARETALEYMRKDAPEALKMYLDNLPGPFMAGLDWYTKKHVALPLDHQDVMLSKLACGAFVLGSEGKLKLFAPARSDGQREAADIVIQHLVDRANGSETRNMQAT